MFEQFERYLTSHVDISKQELEHIRSMTIMRKLQRREMLLTEGEVCRHKHFVVKGLLRGYRLDENGAEYIMRFAAEEVWIIDPESYHSGLPSIYNIEALEPTELLSWPKEVFNQLCDTIPGLMKIMGKITTESLTEIQSRILANISYTPEEKYQQFITTYPNIFQRVPLHMVASFLGISRETLSRVRQAQGRPRTNA